MKKWSANQLIPVHTLVEDALVDGEQAVRVVKKGQGGAAGREYLCGLPGRCPARWCGAAAAAQPASAGCAGVCPGICGPGIPG